jgi:2-polyprenyl-3-methyl-5-hydroxy-6-metoxy-1,4-benzoquinol methylase
LRSPELAGYYASYYHAENLAFGELTDARYRQLLRSFERHRQLGRILDVGCGSGQFLKAASAQGWAAYGTEIASGTFEQLSALGIRYHEGELHEANFDAGSFDVVYCSEVIEHVLDPRLLLHEIHRIVRNGGLVYLTTPNYNSLTRRLIGMKWRIFSREHLSYFTPSVLARAVGEAGFSRVECRTRNVDPNELRRAWQGSASESDTGFQIQANERLRRTIESSRALKFGKACVNSMLSLAGAGDTIVAMARN